MSTTDPFRDPAAAGSAAHPGYGYAPPGYGYGPPGYGPPGYGYGAPGYPPGGPPGYPPGLYRRPTNAMAILALVLALAFAPAGLVVGIVARRQIRRTGEEGAGLALAGIVIGSIGTAVFALLVLAWIVAVVMLTSGY
jgi:hypothetical protein